MGESQPVKPQIQRYRNALFAAPRVSLHNVAEPACRRGLRVLRPATMAWFSSDLDTVGSPCRQARAATGLQEGDSCRKTCRRCRGGHRRGWSEETIMAIFDVGRMLRPVASALGGAAILLAAASAFWRS